NGSEPWRIPEASELPKIEVTHPGPRAESDPPFLPYKRNERLARPWATPGTPGLEHRIGGLEKQDVTGNVSYDPLNHEHMINTRARKVQLVADDIPEQEVLGETSGDLLVISWGGTYGACRTAVRRLQTQGRAVSHAHLRYLNPLPRNLGDLMNNFKQVVVPELNLGQLRTLLRAKYLVEAKGFNKVQGKPFSVGELMDHFEQLLGE
ncbi:MAG: 2-oxoglutarate ferredoxin oxidoreductase subunit alpha, partial [Planctomycetales bacterium]|nr:2-oxoglutarate ferredoxin oxidoreductase subunit alpha [Planctomycetales bacterium]